ncbi:NAD(P)/FAD-dependent oxidoreductase [Ruegeria sp. R13_0]|uniref:flavin-containing monooxygenase n=1 Tax=Ruegeria sp. R13_0 TaxID=2821099 RepID=UPI001ADAFE27|nr:NAD(P)/FAD-dependent oxidoreductase [Ruegeria sp. R13_0]MBO9436435.1 NAD(P)/FAD-dependent oxidoreductase [Ruegeria sp. R13_0]
MKHFDKHTLIIGAGLTGLATAHVLQNRGIPVTVLDASDRVAWNWQQRHPALRLNVHRKFAALPGKPAPRTDGAYLKRDTLVQYLKDYAFDLRDCIETGVLVSGVDPTSNGWRVTAGSRIFDASNVVIATGRDRSPHIPNWRGLQRFKGKVIHAANLGDVSQYDGKKVLVVGAGNSGGDVLNHLARHKPKDVRISVRHGPSIVPQRVFGFPLHLAAHLFAAMPLWMVDPAFALTQRLFFGDLRKYGLTSHSMGGGTRLATDGTAFAIDDGFVAAIKSGRFKVVGEVTEFWDDRVSFDCYRTFEPDVVICATGYKTALEPLLSHLGVLNEVGIPKYPTGEHVPGLPGLWFNGFRPEFQGYFYSAAKGAQRIGNGILSEAGTSVRNQPSPQAKLVA